MSQIGSLQFDQSRQSSLSQKSKKGVRNFQPFQIVALTYPYKTWFTQPTQALFNEILSLKLKGYGAEYPFGVLPIDTTDFIASHYMVGFQSKKNFRPLMAFKTTPLRRCEQHQLSFPGLNLVQQAQAPEHIAQVQKIMERVLWQKKELAYLASWTVDPIVRKDKEMAQKLRDIFKGLFVHCHRELNVEEVLIGGTLRFKTERIFSELGCQPLTDQFQMELSPIQVKHLFAEKVMVMHLQKFSENAEHSARNCADLWEKRISYSPENISEFQKRLIG